MIAVLNCWLLTGLVSRYRSIWWLLIQDRSISTQNMSRFLGTYPCIAVLFLLDVSICWWCTISLNMLNCWLKLLIIGLLIAIHMWLIRKETLMLHLRRLGSRFMTSYAVLSVELGIYSFCSIPTWSTGNYLWLFSHWLYLLHFLLAFSALRPIIGIGNIILCDIHFVIHWLCTHFWQCGLIHGFDASDSLLCIWLIFEYFIIHCLH